VNTAKVYAVIISFVMYRIVNVGVNFDAGVDLGVAVDFLSLMDLAPPYYSETCWIIILPVVLYGCETWSLSLREEHGLKIFENSVQRIF
jgi:hypothetical protein